MVTNADADLRRALLLVACLILPLAPTAAQPPTNEQIGSTQIQQPLITDAPVISAEEQEQLSLVEIRRAGLNARRSLGEYRSQRYS